jgi:hypothetical protein
MCELIQKKQILSNIIEAREQLQEIEESLQNDTEYTEIEMRIDLEHAYHHLNYAWNIRNVSNQQIKNMTDEDFRNWSKYPKDDMSEYE